MKDLDFADFYFNRLFAVPCGLLRCGLCIGTGALHAHIETPTKILSKQTTCFKTLKNWIIETIRLEQVTRS